MHWPKFQKIAKSTRLIDIALIKNLKSTFSTIIKI
jgi:hypothetical protein